MARKSSKFTCIDCKKKFDNVYNFGYTYEKLYILGEDYCEKCYEIVREQFDREHEREYISIKRFIEENGILLD